MFETKEVAKNPTADIQIKCRSCSELHSLVTSLQERPVTVRYGSVVEGVLVCPHCQSTKHVYYMTEHLRNEQRLLQKYVDEWQHTQSDRAFRSLVAKKNAYKNAYDRVQEKYKKEFGNGSNQE